VEENNFNIYKLEKCFVFQGKMTKFDKANEYLKRKELKEAQAVLEELLQEEPNNGDALYNLGMIYTELGQPEKAVETLQGCIDSGQDNANVYVALGYAHSKLGNQNKARELFLSALEIEPDNPYALRNIGALYGKEANYESAIRYFERSLSFNPSDVNTAYGLGMSYFNLGDLANADRYLRKTIEIDESSSVSQRAKDLLSEIAALNLKAKGFRTDAMFYCIHAMRLFDTIGPEETKKISFEIALKGQQGLDINDPSKKYTLNSLEGVFTGLQLVSYMYIGFKRIAPQMDVGIDLSEEYGMALQFINLKRLHEYSVN
jgi:tetratricopeptide (TPR) repeat protein